MTDTSAPLPHQVYLDELESLDDDYLDVRDQVCHLEARRGALLNEIERLQRENAMLHAAYAQDLDGLRAELRRADDERAAWRVMSRVAGVTP